MSKKNRPIAYAMSRRRRFIIIVLCVLAAVIFVRLDHIYHNYRLQSSARRGAQTQAGDFEKYHTKSFTVTNIVDGDTIDIDIPDGRGKNTRIRLWGIDTPETKNPRTGQMYFGTEAADYAKELALGKKVTIYLEEHRTRGKYGRLLAYVKLPEGKFLNEVLLTDGFAYADLRFRHSFYNKYKQSEASARSQKKGLWENVMREQLPQWLQRRKPNMLKNRK